MTEHDTKQRPSECPKCHSRDKKQLNEACQSKPFQPIHLKQWDPWHTSPSPVPAEPHGYQDGDCITELSGDKTWVPAEGRSAPEICQNCAQAYVCWFAPSDIWNKAISERTAMLCPNCFLARAERAGLTQDAWKLQPEFYAAAETTPSTERPSQSGLMNAGPITGVSNAEPKHNHLSAAEWQITEQGFAVTGPDGRVFRTPMCHLHYGDPARGEMKAQELSAIKQLCELLNAARGGHLI